MKIDLIFIGDGMSGKTSLLKKKAELVLQQFAEKYEQYLVERGIPSFHQWKSQHEDLQPALNLLENDFSRHFKENEFSYPQKQYFKWATRQYNVVSFEDWMQHLGVNLGNHLKADTSAPTLGMDTISIVYPERDDLIQFSGYDLGGQNIYDQIREVIAGLAKPESFIVTVFDSSRFLSCENSIHQLIRSMKKFELKDYVPTVIAVFNKIDLQQYMNQENWQDFTAEYLANALMEVKRREVKYTVPNLVFRGEIKEIILPPTEALGFEHVEALIYSQLRKREPTFGKPPFTEVNAKAIAREIAAQLLVHQNPDQGYYEKLKRLIFEQRPLAVQYIESIKLSSTTSEETQYKESLHKLRKKFEGFELELTSDAVNKETIKKILANCVNLKDIEMALEEQGFPTFRTNALDGTGVEELFNFMIEKRKESKTEESKRRTRRLTRL